VRDPRRFLWANFLGRPTHPRAAGLLLTLPAEIAASAACPAKGIEIGEAAGACAQRTLPLLRRFC